MTGRVGGVVYSNEQDGVGLRNHNPTSKQPFTPAQLAIEANFTKAAKAWVTLAPATAALWKSYALSQKVRNPITGKSRARNARHVFIGLYAKLLQAYPNSVLPTVPSGAYGGDSLNLTCVPSTGKVTITASGENSLVTTTEILAYRLPSPNSIPDRAQMRTMRFNRFVAGSLSVDVPVSAGTWAFAYRYLNRNTGQDTGLYDLPLQTVALSVEDGGFQEESLAQAA